MSYINDALRKAQKEKESHYRAYSSVIGVVNKDGRRSSQVILYTGLLAVIVVIIGSIFYLYGVINESKTVPVQVPAAISQPVAVLPSSLPIADAPQPGNVAAKKTDAQIQRKDTFPVKEKLSAGEADALFIRAVNKQDEGKLTEAQKLYAEVISNSPRHVQAKNNLGVIYLSQKNYKAAEKLFKEALILKPKFVDVHYNLACLYAQKKEYARSIYYLKTAIGINPDVRNWARNDNDLKELGQYPEFNNLMEEQIN